MKLEKHLSIVLGAAILLSASTGAIANKFGNTYNYDNRRDYSRDYAYNYDIDNNTANSNSSSRAYGGTARAYGGQGGDGGDANQDQQQGQQQGQVLNNENDIDNSTSVRNSVNNSDYNSVRNSNTNKAKQSQSSDNSNEGNNTNVELTDNSVYEDASNPVNASAMAIGDLTTAFSSADFSGAIGSTSPQNDYRAAIARQVDVINMSIILAANGNINQSDRYLTIAMNAFDQILVMTDQSTRLAKAGFWRRLITAKFVPFKEAIDGATATGAVSSAMRVVK